MIAMSVMGGPPQGAGNGIIVDAFHSALTRQGLLIFVVLLVLVVAWNALRSAQYRRAAASGISWPPPPRVLAPEPVARRVLRIGFAVIWVFDGLLQAQSGMPTGMATQVLQPAAATSPGWVQHLVDFGATTWTLHPVPAAAATVWIQVGIGVFLLVAPRGRWSRAAGAVSLGWALVVWAFGEAFGGVFAPGLTVLFGAPGAVLFYAVAGGLIALPDRAWVGPRLGRIVTGSVGAFLLGMAVLQAWPGRGFWQGGTTANPGTLAGMAAQMSGTPQPHVLSSAVSSFASFDRGHGWGVNLLVVVALALLGLAFLSGRRRVMFPALVVLIVLGLADWVFIEDFGFLGGVGTDPNSMPPLLLLVTGGYLAVVRAPTSMEVPAQAADTAAATAAATTARPRWATVDSGYAGRLALAAGALFAVLVGSVPMASASVNRQADPIVTESVDGPPADIGGRAPDFNLVDQHGHPVTLTSLRGDTVALTFLDPVCTTDCPLIAQEFRATDQMLGAAANKVKFVAIAANPLYHSVADIDAFDRQEGMNTLSNWLFLTGPTPRLRAVLNAYGVEDVVLPAGGMVGHADSAYVIDARGDSRVALDDDPGSQSVDASSFSSLLADEVTRVMNS
jgi:cytochrome oxidase Cu insertion factor (SCO1/SenC/PrrC family)